MGCAQAVANLAAGNVLDWGRRKKGCFVAKYVLLCVNLSSGLVFLFLPSVVTTDRAIAFGIGFGLSQGARSLVYATLYAELFGRTHLGAIQGTNQSVGILGTGLGPFILGLGYDFFGSFAPILRIVAALPLAMAVVQLLCLRPPSRKAR